MFSVGKQSVRLCQGMSRRDFLHVGALGAAGLTLPQLLQARQTQPNSVGSTFGKARSCIILFMIGGPAHQDTFDLKPAAPAEIRGEFNPIATNVPGIHICEHLPRLAKLTDRYTIVRSVTHRNNNHTPSAFIMQTGNTTSGGAVRPENDFREFSTDPPSLGSVIARSRGVGGVVPPYVFFEMGYYLPSGRGAGYLGRTHEPFKINTDPNAADFEIRALALPRDVSLDRLNSRHGLLDSVNRQMDDLQVSGSAPEMDSCYQRAFDIVSSAQARTAFNLAAEPSQVRDQYGRHTFGQGALLARRLVEHGVSLVTVNWYNYQRLSGPYGGKHWDTHIGNFPELRDNLLPPADRAFAALLTDLDCRGLLDETLVIWMGEFGRTPRINGSAGRDHWGGCLSVVLAGAGIRGGQVYGASDKQAAYPADNPVRAQDLIATIYHCLGISTDAFVPDQTGRPNLVCHGEPVMGLFR